MKANGCWKVQGSLELNLSAIIANITTQYQQNLPNVEVMILIFLIFKIIIYFFEIFEYKIIITLEEQDKMIKNKSSLGQCY